jgi:histidine ammonia-lyase
MARKKTALVVYQQEKRVWSLNVRSADRDLRQDLIDTIAEAEKRGLAIINSTNPFAGIDATPRKAKGKKAVLASVEGGKTDG